MMERLLSWAVRSPLFPVGGSPLALLLTWLRGHPADVSLPSSEEHLRREYRATRRVAVEFYCVIPQPDLPAPVRLRPGDSLTLNVRRAPVSGGIRNVFCPIDRGRLLIVAVPL